MTGLERLTRLLNRLLVFVGGSFLVGMILLTCANIASRTVWQPIRGTFELMGYFGAVVTALALAYTLYGSPEVRLSGSLSNVSAV